MIMDEHRICFIICVNNDLFFDECVRYIRWLKVPDGMEVELLEIRDAVSMASGYNEGMCASNAKYKIYMHQDVFIVNRYFIYDILSIFRSDKNVGMVGLVGSPRLPKNGIMWLEDRVDAGTEKVPWEKYQYDGEKDGWWEVEGADGLLLATQFDIWWREDLFDGWDFYDISQCFEMRKRGLRVVVPVQNCLWYIHDDRPALTMWNYDKYRQIFIEEYLKPGI